MVQSEGLRRGRCECKAYRYSPHPTWWHFRDDELEIRRRRKRGQAKVREIMDRIERSTK